MTEEQNQHNSRRETQQSAEAPGVLRDIRSNLLRLPWARLVWLFAVLVVGPLLYAALTWLGLEPGGIALSAATCLALALGVVWLLRRSAGERDDTDE